MFIGAWAEQQRLSNLTRWSDALLGNPRRFALWRGLHYLARAPRPARRISSRSAAICCSWLTPSPSQPRSMGLRVEAGRPAGPSVVAGAPQVGCRQRRAAQITLVENRVVQIGTGEVSAPQIYAPHPDAVEVHTG